MGVAIGSSDYLFLCGKSRFVDGVILYSLEVKSMLDRFLKWPRGIILIYDAYLIRIKFPNCMSFSFSGRLAGVLKSTGFLVSLLKCLLSC